MTPISTSAQTFVVTHDEDGNATIHLAPPATDRKQTRLSVVGPAVTVPPRGPLPPEALARWIEAIQDRGYAVTSCPTADPPACRQGSELG